jgi:signal transduction histidine kinase
MPANPPVAKQSYGERLAAWLCDGPGLHRVVCAVVFAAAIFLANQLFHYLLDHDHFRAKHMAADALSGAVIGYFALRLLEAERRYREHMFERLRIIRELNHQVRNSLEVIAMSAYSTRDRVLFGAIDDSVQRIQRALREVLGPAKPESRKPPGTEQAGGEPQGGSRSA